MYKGKEVRTMNEKPTAEEFAQYCFEHITVLVANYKADGSEYAQAFGGFLCQFKISENEVLPIWVTAAHIKSTLIEIREKYGLKRLYFISPTLLKVHDTAATHLDVRKIDGITCLSEISNPDPKKQKSIRNMDLAFLQLNDYYAENMRSSGLRFFEDKNFDYDGAAKYLSDENRPIGALLCGIPMDSYQQVDGGVSADCVSIQLEIRGWREFPLVEFEITDQSNSLESVNGLSGCPIVLYGAEYPIVIGVQSREVTRTRVESVVAVDFQLFVEIVKRAISTTGAD